MWWKSCWTKIIKILLMMQLSWWWKVIRWWLIILSNFKQKMNCCWLINIFFNKSNRINLKKFHILCGCAFIKTQTDDIFEFDLIINCRKYTYTYRIYSTEIYDVNNIFGRFVKHYKKYILYWRSFLILMNSFTW